MTADAGSDPASAAARLARRSGPAAIVARHTAAAGADAGTGAGSGAGADAGTGVDAGAGAGSGAGADAAASGAATLATPYDPLRLCIYATIAALGWLLGPLALTLFAAIGFAGYWRAWRGGLRRSRCWLRDTRLVLLYLALLAAAGVAGIVLFVLQLTG